jgi:hypothetical protein
MESNQPFILAGHDEQAKLPIRQALPLPGESGKPLP